MRLDWISKLENNIPFYVIFFSKRKGGSKDFRRVWGRGTRNIKWGLNHPQYYYIHESPEAYPQLILEICFQYNLMLAKKLM